MMLPNLKYQTTITNHSPQHFRIVKLQQVLHLGKQIHRRIGEVLKPISTPIQHERHTQLRADEILILEETNEGEHQLRKILHLTEQRTPSTQSQVVILILLSLKPTQNCSPIRQS